MLISDILGTLTPADKARLLLAGPVEPWMAMVYQGGESPAADAVLNWMYLHGHSGTLAQVSYLALGTLDADLITNLVALLRDAQILDPATASALLAF